MDSLWQGLIDQQIQTPMGVTAENLAKKYEISREECDAFAVQSATRWKAGRCEARFVETQHVSRPTGSDVCFQDGMEARRPTLASTQAVCLLPSVDASNRLEAPLRKARAKAASTVQAALG